MNVGFGPYLTCGVKILKNCWTVSKTFVVNVRVCQAIRKGDHQIGILESKPQTTCIPYVTINFY